MKTGLALCTHLSAANAQHGGSSRGLEERKQENKISSLWLTARQAWLAGTWRGAQVPSGRRTGPSLDFGARSESVSLVGRHGRWGRRSMAGQLTVGQTHDWSFGETGAGALVQGIPCFCESPAMLVNLSGWLWRCTTTMVNSCPLWSFDCGCQTQWLLIVFNKKEVEPSEDNLRTIFVG